MLRITFKERSKHKAFGYTVSITRLPVNGLVEFLATILLLGSRGTSKKIEFILNVKSSLSAAATVKNNRAMKENNFHILNNPT
jgi:hypothetical protein